MAAWAVLNRVASITAAHKVAWAATVRSMVARVTIAHKEVMGMGQAVTRGVAMATKATTALRLIRAEVCSAVTATAPDTDHPRAATAHKAVAMVHRVVMAARA